MRDARSFDDFYRSTSARTLRYGHAVVGDPGEAQDLVQEAYARAWRQWGRTPPAPGPRSTRTAAAVEAIRRWWN
ncbi:sigma-70-like protein [Micromonospora kangleipakensis]|uniref:Sigma-70-like protein n=1 Tax=Micromonospora kangleipakensis TaxID=1077942 RepID=A0A4Q8BK89_9ACTN|nr:sigma factor [Micromonospora kangleipakensis]RZU77995.1 sigma-70-like protein [Micromonospora kangleipakensis]